MEYVGNIVVASRFHVQAEPEGECTLGCCGKLASSTSLCDSSTYFSASCLSKLMSKNISAALAALCETQTYQIFLPLTCMSGSRSANGLTSVL